MSEFCRWRRNEGYEACADDMEGAAAHPVPARPDSKMPGSLLGGNRLFHSFKNIQIGKSSRKSKKRLSFSQGKWQAPVGGFRIQFWIWEKRSLFTAP